MIELPIIDLDMSRKDIVYKIPQLAFDAEDGVYLVRFRPIDYDWTDKVARIIHSLEDSGVGHQSDELDVTDGVVSWQASAAVLRPGKNLLQLNIYGRYTEFRQIAPMVGWYLREALQGADPMPDDVDAIEGLTAQVNTTVDSLATVETTCTEAAAAAAQSAEDASYAANAASESASLASASETASSGSAESALSSAQAALGSAQAASASAANANDSEVAASGSASAASLSAATAMAQASLAAGSAGAASASAGLAADSASEAVGSAEASASAASAAALSAADAEAAKEAILGVFEGSY